MVESSSVNSFWQRLRRAISTRVHNPHLQARLQIGSSLALGAGLLVTALIFSGVFDPIDARLSRLLFEPRTHTHLEQDRFIQIVMVFLIAILSGATLPHFGMLTAAGLMLVYFLFYLVYAFDNFNRRVVVEPLYPALVLLITFAATMIVRYYSEERPRALIGRLFRRRVADDEMDQVLDRYDQGTLRLEGIQREVSVMHVDLREFSNRADQHDPQTLIQLMNQYTAIILPTIFRHRGTVANQTGNGITAVWNLPLEEIGHAACAVRAAMEISREIKNLNRKDSPIIESGSNHHAIDIGIGIATGVAVAGHIGKPGQADYTLLGEVMTLAERIALKPERGIYLDGTTLEQLSDEFETQQVDPVRLRRRTDAIGVWQVLDPLVLQEVIESEESAQQ